MKTREIQKAIDTIIVKMNRYFNTSFIINRITKKDRDNKGRFFVKYKLEIIKLDYQFGNFIDIGSIKDIRSTDLTFEKLKPQIKKILGEHFGFLRKVKNLFR